MSSGGAPAEQAILVVEDDQDVAAMLSTYLGLHGYAVTTASDAEEALVRLAEAQPRVAVIDAHLPGRSGLDLTRELRQRAASPAIVIYTAGMSTPAEAKAAGADRFLLKTAPLGELLNGLEALGARPAVGLPPASAS
jgi:DNA-binding response OmpR family regulator